MQHLFPGLLIGLLTLTGLNAEAQTSKGELGPKSSATSATSKDRHSRRANQKNDKQSVANRLGSFDEFVNNVNADFEDFRNQVIENYDKWLEGEWVEFKPEPGRIRYTSPKPSRIPVAPGVDETAMRSKASGHSAINGLLNESDSIQSIVTDSNNREMWSVMGTDAMKAITGNRDAQRLVKDAQYRRTRPDDHTPGDWFKFYDLELRIPSYDYQIIGTMMPYDVKETGSFSALRENSAAQWRILEEEQVGAIVGKELADLAKSMNLNDYLRYELTRSYVNSKFPDASQMSRTALVHYLLVHQGYGALLGSYDGASYLVLPSQQELFQIPRMPGTYNYLFNIDNEDLNNYVLRAQFFCVEPPKSMKPGADFDFRIDNLKLPEMPREYCIALGDMMLEGTVNVMLMPILHKYPQMSTEGFAESSIDQKFRKELVNQVKAQLAGLSPEEAAQKLLTFIQWGFEYATDDEQHGFEKPYFVEENFFYPANDCEDRSILFTTLLWEVLGLESQLLAYPNHESASVKLPQCISNDSYYYTFAGEPFVIADPTYQGAPIGAAMRDYRDILPERVDLYLNSIWQQTREQEKAAKEEAEKEETAIENTI